MKTICPKCKEENSFIIHLYQNIWITATAPYLPNNGGECKKYDVDNVESGEMEPIHDEYWKDDFDNYEKLECMNCGEEVEEKDIIIEA